MKNNDLNLKKYLPSLAAYGINEEVAKIIVSHWSKPNRVYHGLTEELAYKAIDILNVKN